VEENFTSNFYSCYTRYRRYQYK